MTEEERIHIDEEDIAGGEKANIKTDEWVEELKVAGKEVISTIEALIDDTSIRRIIVKRGEKELIEIPLVLGMAGLGAGIVLAPYVAALGIIAALALDCSILVVRSEKQPEETAEPAVAAE